MSYFNANYMNALDQDSGFPCAMQAIDVIAFMEKVASEFVLPGKFTTNEHFTDMSKLSFLSVNKH